MRLAPRQTGTRVRSWMLVAILLAIIVLPFVLFGAQLDAWTRNALAVHGGVAAQSLCVLLLAADVLLPVPSSVVGAACGLWWGVLAGTGLGTLGLTLGSCLGYGLGRWAGAGRVGRWVGAEATARIERLFARRGPWIVALLRPVPVLAEASAMLAGVGRMPFVRFLLISSGANAIVALSYAAAGTLIGRLPAWGAVAALFLALAMTAAPWRMIAMRRLIMRP